MSKTTAGWQRQGEHEAWFRTLSAEVVACNTHVHVRICALCLWHYHLIITSNNYGHTNVTLRKFIIGETNLNCGAYSACRLDSMTHVIEDLIRGVMWCHSYINAWLYSCVAAWLHGCIAAWLHSCPLHAIGVIHAKLIQ